MKVLWILVICLVAVVSSQQGHSQPVPSPSSTPSHTCTNGKVYEQCGTACPLTCKNKDRVVICNMMCVAGCFCPSGMVLHNNECIQPSQCPLNATPSPSSAPTYQAPYVEPPLQCPNSTGLGSCLIESVCSATGSGDCGTGKLCCSTGCGGKLCTTGVTPSPLCAAVKLKAQNVSSGLLGAYIPQCDDSGQFSQTQCHEGFCWCVNVETGKATSQPARGAPNCFTKSGVNATLSPSSTPAPTFQAPYVEPPLQCPNTSSLTRGACVIESTCSETGSGDCGTGKLCCSTGCGGKLCTTGVTPSPLCAAVKLKAQNVSSGLLGAYIPQCDDSGQFSQRQCHEGFCWCVNVETGKATSAPARGAPNCSASISAPATAAPEPACTNGKVHTVCGSACPLTCANKDNPPSCIQECVEGCFCPSGMVLNGDTCVQATDCPQSCTNGKVHNVCGSACPLTCANKDNPPSCIDECVDGCFCPSGMVLNGDTCVQATDCPPPSSSCTVNGVTHANGTSFTAADGCNTCHCINGVAGCTRMMCAPCVVNGVSHASGTSFTAADGCNTCHCTNGLAACTLMLCPPCVVDGVSHASGTSFKAPDGCNTCFCSNGKAACTEKACISTTSSPLPDYCNLAPQTGNCRASVPSFFYNSTSSKCESFTYGGCGGNDNRFSTKLACLEACAGVTVELPSVPSNLSHVSMCPSVNEDVTGSCSEDCSADTDCEDWEKCCSNGCGHSCATPTTIPYYKPPMKCPPINPVLGIFCSIDFGCKSHAVCNEGELCCPTGCGSTCMTAIKPSPLCAAVKNSTQTGLIGAYVPQCDTDGNFSTVQCHASTGMCWCANTTTGKPLSAPVMHAQPTCDVDGLNCDGLQCDWPNCGDGVQPISDSKHCCPYCPPPSSSSCTVNGVTHANGTSFTAADGCNTCHCINGVAGCTRMLCPPCVVDGVTHASGTSFKAPDGCNTCFCSNGNAACTEMACPPCTVDGKTYPSGTNFTSPDGCNTCFCSNGVAVCTERACLPVCSAGGLTIGEGQHIDDGCSVCTCLNRKISCTTSGTCTSPIHRIVNVTMKFSGNFDAVTQNMDAFKSDVKQTLLNKYSIMTGLRESQISNIHVSRGSVIVTVIIHDSNDLTNSANVTHLLILIEQDYKNNSLIISSQHTTLKPTGDFHYQTTSDIDSNESDDGGSATFWIYVSMCGLLLVLISLLTIAIVVVFKKRRYQFRHHRLPVSDNDNDYVTVKGVPNPVFTVQMEKI